MDDVIEALERRLAPAHVFDDGRGAVYGHVVSWSHDGGPRGMDGGHDVRDRVSRARRLAMAPTPSAATRPRPSALKQKCGMSEIPIEPMSPRTMFSTEGAHRLTICYSRSACGA